VENFIKIVWDLKHIVHNWAYHALQQISSKSRNVEATKWPTTKYNKML